MDCKTKFWNLVFTHASHHDQQSFSDLRLLKVFSQNDFVKMSATCFELGESSKQLHKGANDAMDLLLE